MALSRRDTTPVNAMAQSLHAGAIDSDADPHFVAVRHDAVFSGLQVISQVSRDMGLSV